MQRTALAHESLVKLYNRNLQFAYCIAIACFSQLITKFLMHGHFALSAAFNFSSNASTNSL